MRDALLDYALRIAAVAGRALRSSPRRLRSAALSCLLVGSGAGGVTVRDSRGGHPARRRWRPTDRLAEAELDGRVVIDRIEFLELYEDMAIAAAEALDGVLRRRRAGRPRLHWPSAVYRRRRGRRCAGCAATRPPGWWQRLEIARGGGRRSCASSPPPTGPVPR